MTVIPLKSHVNVRYALQNSVQLRWENECVLTEEVAIFQFSTQVVFPAPVHGRFLICVCVFQRSDSSRFLIVTVKFNIKTYFANICLWTCLMFALPHNRRFFVCPNPYSFVNFLPWLVSSSPLSLIQDIKEGDSRISPMPLLVLLSLLPLLSNL